MIPRLSRLALAILLAAVCLVGTHAAERRQGSKKRGDDGEEAVVRSEKEIRAERVDLVLAKKANTFQTRLLRDDLSSLSERYVSEAGELRADEDLSARQELKLEYLEAMGKWYRAQATALDEMLERRHQLRELYKLIRAMKEEARGDLEARYATLYREHDALLAAFKKLQENPPAGPGRRSRNS